MKQSFLSGTTILFSDIPVLKEYLHYLGQRKNSAGNYYNSKDRCPMRTHFRTFIRNNYPMRYYLVERYSEMFIRLSIVDLYRVLANANSDITEEIIPSLLKRKSRTPLKFNKKDPNQGLKNTIKIKEL